MRVWRWAKVAWGGCDGLEDGGAGDGGISCGAGRRWRCCEEGLTTCGLGNACRASKDLIGAAVNELDGGVIGRARVRGATEGTRADMLFGNTKATSASELGLIMRVRFASIDRPRETCLVACGAMGFGFGVGGRSLVTDFVGDGTGV